MSINSCSINRQTINAACGLHSVLSSSIINYSTVLEQGQVVALTDIGDFFGGPVTSIVISSGALNGPGGSLSFSVDAGTSGNIYFEGNSSNDLGVYSGQIRLYGTVNFVTINFSVTIVERLANSGGGQQQHVNPNTIVPLSIFKRRAEEEDEIVDIELPWITVTIQTANGTFTQTLDRQEIIPMINVFGVKFTSIDEEQVNISQINISDINIRIK